jgi:hypothetical protein
LKSSEELRCRRGRQHSAKINALEAGSRGKHRTFARLAISGATVFLNSRVLSEVEATCDHVAFIKHGEVLETRSLRELIEGEIRVGARALLGPRPPGRTALPGGLKPTYVA